RVSCSTSQGAESTPIARRRSVSGWPSTRPPAGEFSSRPTTARSRSTGACRSEGRRSLPRRVTLLAATVALAAAAWAALDPDRGGLAVLLAGVAVLVAGAGWLEGGT